MRFFVLVTLLLAPFAFAQEETFDAGVVSEPPLISTDALPPPQLPVTPAVAAKKGPPGEPRWNRATGSLTGVLSGFRDYYAGVELFGGVVFGTPQLSPPAAEPRGPPSSLRDVTGWLVVPGLQLMWARLSGPICAGSEFCGQRWVAGAAVRVGYAAGVARHDGAARVRSFSFGELSTSVAYVVVPAAPLTAGSTWAEGVFRFRGGVQLNAASGQRAQAEGNGIILHLSGLVEYLAFSPVGGGLQLGVSFGLAF